MLLRVKKIVPADSAAFAARFVRGGLFFVSSVGRPDLVSSRVEYKRKTPEVRLSRFPAARVRRVTHPAGRLVSTRAVPPGVTNAGNPPRIRTTLLLEETSSLLGDPLPERAAHWRGRLLGGVAFPPGGTPRVKVYQRDRRSWSPREDPPGGFTGGTWGWHPRKQQNPLLFRREWARRGGTSPLGGRPEREVSSLGGLLRRVRHHRGELFRLGRLERHREGVFGRARRKLKTHKKRFAWFVRRRFRGELLERVTPKNYFQGLTRRSFRRSQVNRFTRLEKAIPLVGATRPGENLARWATWTLGTRVATPLDYNRYLPLGGYPRVGKRRRQGSRQRWKLGQHPRWSFLHRGGRTFRWGWFFSTLLGDYFGQLRRTSVSAEPSDPPLRVTFSSAGYWSVQKWGRSRWKTRPTLRSASVFVGSLKTGVALEHDALQWGGASTAATGVLTSLGVEFELRPTRADAPTRGSARVGVRPGWGGRFLAGGLFLAWRFVFTPLWKLYEGVARGWCLFFWGVRQLFFLGGFSVRTLFLFVRTLLGRIFRPLGRRVVHAVKETPLVKSVAWALTSWNLVVAQEDDQSELETLLVSPPEDNHEPYFMEELDHPGEDHPDYDQLGEGTHVQSLLPSPRWSTWLAELTFWNELEESWSRWVVEEIPFRVGFFVQPPLELLLKLPVWKFAEGLSLVGLTFKLERHRWWRKVLQTRGVGKFWVVLGGRLAGWVLLGLVWYALGTQLSYSTCRIEVTYTLGVPWREEYYLGWWFFCLVGSVRLVGPFGLKKFFFRELGFSNLVGLFFGVAHEAPPEEYHPGRPAGIRPGLFLPVSKARGSWWTVRHDVQEDRTFETSRVNLTGFDEARLILFREYNSYETPLVDEEDETPNFFFPLHLSKVEKRELYPSALEETSGVQRSLREPHLRRNNRYDLPWSFERNLLFPLPHHYGYPSQRDQDHHFGGETSSSQFE